MCDFLVVEIAPKDSEDWHNPENFSFFLHGVDELRSEFCDCRIVVVVSPFEEIVPSCENRRIPKHVELPMHMCENADVQQMVHTRIKMMSISDSHPCNKIPREAEDKQKE